MKNIKFIFYCILILLAIFLLTAAFWYIYIHWRNPIKLLDNTYKDIRIIDKKSYTMINREEKRIFEDTELLARQLDTMRITISFPEDMTDRRFPVVIIMGGIEIGRKSLSYIKRHGQNILISYEYPYSPEYWYDGMALLEIIQIQKAVLIVPSQIAGIMDWTLQQTWADTSRINLLGYSFGAVFVPAAHHLVQTKNIKIKSTVLAYGGANIQQLLMTNLKIKPQWLKTLSAFLAAHSIRAMEPELHLPYLKGRFFIINGKYDNQIPVQSYRQLQELTPQPKTIMNLEAGHLHPGNPDLMRQVVDLSTEWLLQNGYINP
jgi:alpha/beta superfamily hydrolase